MSLDDLDKKLWKRLKKEAGIKSSKWFKKADASVGKYIESMNKAKKKFEQSQMATDLLKFQDALDDLNKAFNKFADAKHLDDIPDTDLKADEKKKLYADIATWKDDIQDAKDKLDKKIKKLVNATGGDVKKINSMEAKKRVAVWNQIGIGDTFDL